MDLMKGTGNKFHRKTFNLLMIFLVYSSAIYFFSFITADPDLWGHLKFGEDIWNSRSISKIDIYSFTAYGNEWTNHEWLSEVLMYYLFSRFDSPGLIIGKITIGLLIISALSVISFNRKSSPLGYGIVFVICVFIMSPGFMTRPQLVTFLFSAIFLLIFHLYFEKRMNLLWLLPIIMIIWVNSHGGFVIGLGMFPVIIFCEGISYLFSRNKRRNNFRNLILWMILTGAAVLVNPYGLSIITFLYESLSAPRNISEWAPIGIFDLSYLRFKILAVLTIVLFFLSRDKNRSWEIGVVIISMLYAFLHQRHSPIFAIIAAPFVSEKLSELEKRIGLNKRIQSITSYILLNIFILILIGYQISNATNKYIETGFNIIVDPLIYPVYAVGFLKENHIKGNILLPFEWGEYAIWKLYPDNKVSIDGRFRTVYPEDVLDDHLKNLNDGIKFKEVLDRYEPDILMVRRTPQFRELMGAQEKWIYVYSDPACYIFLKDSPELEEIIHKINRKEIIYPDKEISIYFP
jgi:hypothetical protein